MTMLSPPPAQSGNPFRLTAEAGGFVLTCVCRWVRYFATRPDSDAGRREHEKRCKTARGEGE